MTFNKQKPLTLIALTLVLGIGVILLLNLEKECPAADCPDCEQNIYSAGKGGTEFLYLYPPGCKGCDTPAIAKLFSDMSLEVRIYQNDGIPFPHILVMKEDESKGNISTIVSALNRYNILQFLCLTKHENACRLSREYLKQMQTCLAGMNISRDTVAFYYSDSCKVCNRSSRWVDEAGKDGYNILWLDENSTNPKVKDQMNCLKEFLNIPEGVPQYICISTGEIHTDTSKDRYTSGDIRSFAGRCKKGAGK